MRLQFEINDTQKAMLERLKEAGDLRSNTDLLNYAFTFLEWAMNELKDGRTIASLDVENDRFKEFDMPPFAKIKNARKERLSPQM